MASVIRVGQSKFVTVPIDEDSSERIMSCIQTLSELESSAAVHQIFLKDTKAAYSKMVAAQEVRFTNVHPRALALMSPCRRKRRRRRNLRRRRPRSFRLTTFSHSASSPRRLPTMSLM